MFLPPEAERVYLIRQVFWLGLLLITFPVAFGGPVVFIQQANMKRIFIARLPHSYGDSAGFAPDFPFNPDF